MSYVMTVENKAKLLAANLGRHMSDETRAKLLAANLGHHPSEETRAKLSKAGIGNTKRLGSHLSEETKAKLSASLKGCNHFPKSEETKAKLAVAHLGCHPSEETRQKISLANSNPSLETRAKMSAAGKGRPKSSEWRAKMSAAQKGCLSRLWQGGLTPENRLIRASGKYWSWRTAVLKRDHFTCQDCGQVGGDLEAHHVMPFVEYPELRFDVDNGKTLCRKCHDKTKQKKVKVAA